MSSSERIFPIVGFFGDDDAEIILKNAAEKTARLIRKNCPELLDAPKKPEKLISLTIQVYESDVELLDFAAIHGATGTRHNGAAALIGKLLVFQFTRQIHVKAEEAEKEEKE